MGKPWTAAQLNAGLKRTRAISLALPEATEALTWGTDINFRVRNKIFCFAGNGGGLTIKANPEERAALLDDSRFRPAPYLARAGWVAMDLQAGGPPSTVDWAEVRELIETSYCMIAPKKLAAQVLQPE